jgi:predicted nucleotidyltransferase component of viral defense system
MILPNSYTTDWIKEKRKTYPKSDPAIMEKVIYALTLVEQLAQTDLSFTFKGGTSLLLILPEPKRFSIDVDIVTTESRERVEAALTQICATGIFKKESATLNTLNSLLK